MTEELKKAEKLARAMNNFMSGGRSFDRNLAAQVRDELRRMDSRIVARTDRIAQLEKENAELSHDNERYVGIANSLANECEELRAGRAQPETDDALRERIAKAIWPAMWWSAKNGWNEQIIPPEYQAGGDTFGAAQALGAADAAIRAMRGDQ